MAADTKFMENPLVVWVDTFWVNEERPLNYRDLYDGIFLNEVMHQIDPRPAYDKVIRKVDDDFTIRLFNWDLLVKNIRAYYVEVLQQLLIIKLPNISAICREPDKDTSFEEIRKVLLLILGCAVQCERKEYFVENIKKLEIDVQHAIVDHIKEITDDSESVLPIEPPEHLEQLEVYTEKTFTHLTRLIKERDDFAELNRDLIQERDFYQSQASGTPAPITPTVSPEKHHLAVELADNKAKLRRTRQELEEKQEQISDVKDELEETKTALAKLRNENLDLVQEARATRSLRDELDIIKEKVSKVDLYEKEIIKYKEKLNELEFYKVRVEELREEKTILEETKCVLEDQLASSHKRVESVIQLENELAGFRQQIEDLHAERDVDRGKIELLTEENLRLEFEKKSSMNESASLEQELGAARLRVGAVGGSLSDQLNETSNARILRLQLENQQLQQKLQEAAEDALIQNAAVNLELEKENHRLSKKVEKLQEMNTEASQNGLHLEQKIGEIYHEKDKLIQTLEMVKENADRQVRELERENEQLAQTVDVIRERNEKSNDARTKDLESENKRLHQNVSAKNAHLSKLEFENKQLQRSYHNMKESVDRISELENENASLEKESSELHQKISALELTCNKYEILEQNKADLEVENRKLSKTVESLKNSLKKKDALEEQHINLTVESQKLQRTLDSLKDSSGKVLELENENDALNREIQQLKKSLDSQKSQKSKHEQMEFELIDLDNENQKLQKTLEITTKRLEQLEQDNTDLENENEKLQKTIEVMKVTAKRLEEREREALELETEVNSLQKDKSCLEKENRKLKQSSELKESSLDDVNAKYTALEQEHRNLKKSVDRMKDICARVKEQEKENKELLQEANLDKRTLATLREDLVNEKIKSQQLSNELEKLSHELERIGINREKLVMAEQTEDENRYKALESMMEVAFKKNMEIKEEKIHSLESRLEESKSRNQKLQNELRVVKREMESLKQRYEEEDFSREKERSSPVIRQEKVYHVHQPPPNNPTREILELKDHLVELERMNATLLAENNNLLTHTSSLHNQIQKLESHNSNIQSQNNSLQGQGSALQSQNAKLQVENTTLQTQCTSLLSHNSRLQSQMSNLQSEHEHLIHNHEELQSSHEALVSDHETLQHLHEQLTADYEALISEHGSLKSIHKSLKNELKDLQDQLDTLLQGKDDVNKLRDLLEKEREQLKSELRALGNLQMDYNCLRDEHDRFRIAYDKLSRDYRDIMTDHKQIKTENNTLQLRNTEMQGEITEGKDTMTSMDVEIQKLENRFDALYQVNQKLDEENRALLMQVSQLLNQNHELLTQALDSKDHYQEEEKSYLEKLAELRRQKERLEEKIMEHYKNRWESPKKNKGLGAILVKKARGIISRAQRSKSRPNLAGDSPENSSVGSGSHADSSEQVNDSSKKSDKKSHRRSSAGNAIDSPGLAKQNKSLAKSTTALNFLKSPGETTTIRGAKSSEDLLNDSSHNASGEKDSLSSGNSTHLLPGLIKPCSLDDDQEAGFQVFSPKSTHTSKVSGRESPGSEMLTLEQFLREANKTSPQAKRKSLDRRSHDDAESRSTGSAGSDPSNKVTLRRQTPVSQVQAPSYQRDPTRRFSSPIPDVAASAQSQHDLNVSRLSRISTGSANIPETSPPSSRPDMTTSTPKANVEISGTRQHVYGDRAKSLEYSKWQGGPHHPSQRPEDKRSSLGTYQRSDDHRSQSTSEYAQPLSPSVGTRTQYVQKTSGPEPLRSPPPPPPVRSSSNRELPPTPSERERLAPTERLDRLMLNSLQSSDQTSPPLTYPSRQNHPNPNDHNSPDKPGNTYSGSHQSRETRPQPQGGIRTQSPAPRNYRSQSPAVNYVQFASVQGRTPVVSSSGGSVERTQGDRPPPYGRPTASASPFPQRQINNNASHTRPASVLGHPTSCQNNYTSKAESPIYSTVERSRQSFEGRPAPENNSGVRTQPVILQANGPHNNNQNNYNSRTQPVERPKSVPPHLFNQASQNSGEDYMQRRTNGPPVAPPRRSREPREQGTHGSRVSLLREPGTAGRSQQQNNTINIPGPQQPHTQNQTGSGQSAVNRLLPNAGTRPPLSQTPTARIQPQTKSNHNKPPAAARPMKPEDQQQPQARQGPKQNSVWPRR